MIKNGGDGRLAFKLDISNCCNNNCKFCYQHGSNRVMNLSLHRAKELICKYRKERDMLIISGGEPTVWPGLFALLRYARKTLNYEHTQLETNARLFCYPQYTNKFIDFLKKTPVYIPRSVYHLRSDFSFKVNIYAHKEAIHDEITCVPGAWRQSTEGIKNLLAHRQEVSTNTVINRINYRYLPEISEFLFGIGILNQEYSLIRGEHEPLEEFCIRYGALASTLKRLINATKKLGVHIFIENVPYCFLKKNEHLMSDNFYPLGKEMRLRYYAYPGIMQKEEYKRRECVYKDTCKYGFICRGIGQHYVKTFGWEDIKRVDFETSNSVGEKKIARLLNKKVPYAISFFSGGIDSKCATALYSLSHPDTRIILLTHDNGCLFPDVGVVKNTSADLLRDYTNIIGHVFLKTPKELVKKVFIDKIAYWQKRKGFNLGCHLCLMTELCFVIKTVKGTYNQPCDFIYGFRQGSNFPRIFIQYIKLFLKQYDINLEIPVFEFKDKAKVEDKLRELKLSEQSHQAICLLTDVRFSEKKGDVNNPVGYNRYDDFYKIGREFRKLRVSEEPFFESFSQLLLRRFNIRKIQSY